MKNIVLELTDPSASDAAVSGSKGATLARMTAAGVAVPRGFVVTTEVFADVTDGKLSGFNESVSRLEASDLEALRGVSDMAREAIRKLELPDAAVSAMKAARERLGSTGVAVRSSATAEDLSGASFAGQYDSFLNVLSLPQIADSLLKVWASLYSVRAISYALTNGIAFEKVRMAVVIQQQLHPHVSGVMFTQDPLTGANRLVVNAALGLGEGVVDGTMPADQFTVEPSNGKIIRSEVAAKETMMVAAPGGGTQRSPVPESQRSKSALSETRLEELATLGSRLEGLLGGPQDIEFAFEDGEVQCLQARPITGVEQPEAPAVDWESHVDTQHTWQPSRMRIHSGPMYRLQQDAVEAYVEGQRVCFEQTGSSMARNCVMQAVHGYSYVRPIDVDDETLAEIQERHNALCDGYTEQGTSKYHQEVRPEVESVLVELNRLRRRKASLPARVEYLAAAMGAFGHVMGHLHWCAGRMDRRIDWPSAFHEITDEPAEIAGVFVQVIPTMTTRMISRLREIARIVQDDGELSAIFAGRGYDELGSPELRRSPKFKAFQSGYRRLMRVHGLRTGWSYGSSSDFETPTWNMAPEKPLDIIASYAEQDLDELDRLEADALRERQHHTRRVRRKLASDPDRLSRFESARKLAQDGVAQMENHNYLMEQCTVGHLYEAISRTGKALVKEGLLDDPLDVLHISADELKQLALGTGPGDLRGLVSRRSAEREERGRLRPPAALGRPQTPTEASPPGPGEPEDAGLDGSVVRGAPASRGRATGPARVIVPGAPPPKILRGDILVAENVGQDWTPIFPLLGALVLDQGALFQHAALVAREYRIPAVILAKDATTSVREGQTITVDGDAGTVELDV